MIFVREVIFCWVNGYIKLFIILIKMDIKNMYIKLKFVFEYICKVFLNVLLFVWLNIYLVIYFKIILLNIFVFIIWIFKIVVCLVFISLSILFFFVSWFSDVNIVLEVVRYII